MNNALVLSEDLDHESVQTLVDLALGNLLPGICNEWLSLSQDIHDAFMREQREKKSVIVRDIASAKDSVQHALREEVIQHVIGIFPYVVIQSCLNQIQREFA